MQGELKKAELNFTTEKLQNDIKVKQEREKQDLQKA